VVVANREFETIVFADYAVVDNLGCLKGPISQTFAVSTDSQNVLGWLKGHLKPGHSYDRPRDGKILAQKMDLSSPVVLNRSRALRKLIKELSPPPEIPPVEC